MHTGGGRLEAQEGLVRARVGIVAKALVIEPIAGRSQLAMNQLVLTCHYVCVSASIWSSDALSSSLGF